MDARMKRPGASRWEAGEDRAEDKAVRRMAGNEGFDRWEIVRARGKRRYGAWSIRRIHFGGTRRRRYYYARLKTEG
ncbi:MAG: hypothetical protein LBG43_09735 [Treponema sp.]|jgi:hypothetical protein|nr:hypothetical protein [Treponema sp.]